MWGGREFHIDGAAKQYSKCLMTDGCADAMNVYRDGEHSSGVFVVV